MMTLPSTMVLSSSLPDKAGEKVTKMLPPRRKSCRNTVPRIEFEKTSVIVFVLAKVDDLTWGKSKFRLFLGRKIVGAGTQYGVGENSGDPDIRVVSAAYLF